VGKGSLIANEYPTLTSQIKENLLSDLNERKIVKTISLRKKVALLAAVALTVGTLGATTSHASDWSSTADLLDCQIGLTTTDDSATGCTQLAGGRVSIGFTEATLAAAGLTDNDGVSATISDAYVSVSGATIVGTVNSGTGVYSTDDITTGEFVWNFDGVNDADGLVHGKFLGANVTTPAKVADTDDNNYIVLTSAAAATATVTLFQYSASGIRTVVETHKVTWLAASTTDLASIQVSTLPGNDADDCTVANKANADHNSITYDEAADQTNGDTNSADLCVLALDGNGSAKTGTNITVIVDGVGLIGGAAVASSSADADGIFQGNITGSLVAGIGKFNVTVTSTAADGVTTITKTGSASITFGDSVAKTVTLTQTVGAIDEGAGATQVATYTIKDGKGSIIAGGATGNLLADSDVSSTTVIDVAGEEDATAAVAVGAAATVTNLGAQTASTGTITVDCAATTYEKITIWMHLETNTVASNKIVVFCTEAIGDVTTETVSVEVATAVAGAKQTVKATILAGLTGFATYPVADIAAAASGGLVFTTSGGTFGVTSPAVVGGVGSTDLFASSITGDYTVIATAGGANGSKAFSVTGGVDTKSLATSIASLNAKIVALNALIAKIMKRLNIR